MDDRFYSEGTNMKKNEATTGNPQSSDKISKQADFGVNIKSDMPVTKKPQQKKFEVHISDFESFAEVPEYKPYGQIESEMPKEKPKAEQKPQTEQPQRRRAPEAKDIGGTMVFNTKKAAPQSRPAPSVAQRRAAAPTQSSGKKAPQAKKVAPKSIPLTSKKAAPVAKKPQKSSAKKPEAPKTKAQKAKEESRYNFVKGLLALCVCVTFITMMTVTASSIALATINDILAINKSTASPVSVEIPAEADFEDVFDILNANGLVRQPIVTKLFLKFRHYDEVTKTDKETGQKYKEKIEYQAGNYFLDINSGIEANIEEMIVRNNYAKDTVRLTFPEGWSIARIFKKIESSNVCTADKLYANLDIVGKQYGFIKDIEAPSGRYLKAEGYLFPDTYDFFIGENASSVLKKLFNNFEAKWTDAYEAQRKVLGMSMDEVITIASIIQREAKDHTQMKDISSVIHNRLKDKATYPSIDMNSTKDYIASLKEYNLFNDFYYDLYLESYNTYSNEGLPPGPICSPGKSAIEAALFPSDTNYHFFCHSENGDVYYASTAAEHQANTNKIIYGGLNND